MTTGPDDGSPPGDCSKRPATTLPGVTAAAVPLQEWSQAFAKQGVELVTGSLLVAAFTLVIGCMPWLLSVAQGGDVSRWGPCAWGSGEMVQGIVGICLGGVATLSIALIAGPALISLKGRPADVQVWVNRVSILKWMQGAAVAAGLLASTGNGVAALFFLQYLAASGMTDGCQAPAQVFPVVMIAAVTTFLAWYAIRPDLELAELSAELRAAEAESTRARAQRIRDRLPDTRLRPTVVPALAATIVLLSGLVVSVGWVSEDSAVANGLALLGLAGAWFLLCVIVLLPVTIYRWNDLSHGGPGLTGRGRRRVVGWMVSSTALFSLVSRNPWSVGQLLVLASMLAGCALAVVLCTTDRLPRLGPDAWVGRWLGTRLARQLHKLEGAGPAPPDDVRDGTGEDP